MPYFIFLSSQVNRFIFNSLKPTHCVYIVNSRFSFGQFFIYINCAKKLHITIILQKPFQPSFWNPCGVFYFLPLVLRVPSIFLVCSGIAIPTKSKHLPQHLRFCSCPELKTVSLLPQYFGLKWGFWMVTTGISFYSRRLHFLQEHSRAQN